MQGQRHVRPSSPPTELYESIPSTAYVTRLSRTESMIMPQRPPMNPIVQSSERRNWKEPALVLDRLLAPIDWELIERPTYWKSRSTASSDRSQRLMKGDDRLAILAPYAAEDNARIPKSCIHDPDRHASFVPCSYAIKVHADHLTHYERSRYLHAVESDGRDEDDDVVPSGDERDWRLAVMEKRLRDEHPDFAKHQDLYVKRQNEIDPQWRQKYAEEDRLDRAALCEELRRACEADGLVATRQQVQLSEARRQSREIEAKFAELFPGASLLSDSHTAPTISDDGNVDQNEHAHNNDSGGTEHRAQAAKQTATKEAHLEKPTEADANLLLNFAKEARVFEGYAEDCSEREAAATSLVCLAREDAQILDNADDIRSSASPHNDQRSMDAEPARQAGLLVIEGSERPLRCRRPITEDLQPLRRIIRNTNHRDGLFKFDEKDADLPEWARRGGPPDAKLDSVQKKVARLAVGLLESVEGKKMDFGALATQKESSPIDALRMPLWRVKGVQNLDDDYHLRPLTSPSADTSSSNACNHQYHLNGYTSDASDFERKVQDTDDQESELGKALQTRLDNEHQKWAEHIAELNLARKSTVCAKTIDPLEGAARVRIPAVRSYVAKFETSGRPDLQTPLEGEEYDMIAVERASWDLDDIFIPPSEPQGIFDQAEVDYHVEKGRQKVIAKLRRQGATDADIEAMHLHAFKMSSAEMDAKAEAATKALIKSRKLLPKAVSKEATPKKRTHSTMAGDSLGPSGADGEALEGAELTPVDRTTLMKKQRHSSDALAAAPMRRSLRVDTLTRAAEVADQTSRARARLDSRKRVLSGSGSGLTDTNEYKQGPAAKKLRLNDSAIALREKRSLIVVLPINKAKLLDQKQSLVVKLPVNWQKLLDEFVRLAKAPVESTVSGMDRITTAVDTDEERQEQQKSECGDEAESRTDTPMVDTIQDTD